MYRNIAFILLVLCLTGCKHNIQEDMAFNYSSLQVDRMESMKECTLLEDSVAMLPLDLSHSSVSIPSKIMIYGDRIFVLDKIIRKQLCVFSSSGKYYGNIGERGWGQGEYSQPYDFDIRNDSIFVIDSNKRKVLVFNLDGKYLMDYNQPKIVDGIIALNDGNFLLSVSEMEKDCDYRLLLMDDKMQEKKGILLMDKERIDDKVADNVFQRVEEKVYYHRSFDSQIVELSQNGECLRIIDVKFKREAVPNLYHTMEYGKLKADLGKHNFEFFIDCPMIVNNILFANCFIGDKKATLAIDRETGIEYDNIFDPQKKIQHYKDLFFPKTYFRNQIVGIFDISLLPLLEDECVLSNCITKRLEDGDVILCFYRIRQPIDSFLELITNGITFELIIQVPIVKYSVEDKGRYVAPPRR